MIVLGHRVDAMTLSGGAALLYALASLSWTTGDVLWSSTILLSFVGAYCLGRFGWSSFFTVFMFAATIFGALASFFGSSTLNPNILGAAIAVTLAAAVVYKQWWYFAFAWPELIFLRSRTALIGAVFISIYAVWRHSKFWAVALTVLLAILVVEQKDDQASSLLTRMGIWQDTLNHLTLFGGGFGSFFESYGSWTMHTNMTLMRPPHAYNDGLELLFELGIGLIPLWFMLIVALSTESEHRLIIMAFLVLGISFFPLFLPPLGQFFFLTLGHISKETSNVMATGWRPSNRRANPA